MTARSHTAFTLLELLVVIGMVGMLSFFLAGGLAGGVGAAALPSSQATMANLVTAARTKAPATGRKTRLLVNVDPHAADRFLRCIVLQIARQPGASPADWDTFTMVSLPEGIYVVPASLTQAGNPVADPAAWKRVSDPSADLVSDLFTHQSLNVAIGGDPTIQAWTGIAFTPNGTLAPLADGPPPKGLVVLAAGLRKPPTGNPSDEAPVQLVNPRVVRGLMLSAYGVPALLDDHTAF